MNKRGKKAVEISFSWIFAIIVGAVIILIAVYATVSFIKTAKYQSYTETAKEISNYLNPLVTGIASAMSPPPIKFKQETKTYVYCSPPDSYDLFGRQRISFSEKARLGEKWSEEGGNISIYNKYVFSDKVERGNKLYLSSLPFYIGYKVDDIITLSTEIYCFIAPPNEVEDRTFVFNNINVTSTISDCAIEDVKVCFNSDFTGCDISVYSNDNFETGYIMKNNTRMDFVSNLMFGAIFSDKEIYECNIKRLALKTAELAYVYKEKIELSKLRGCDSTISNYLDLIAQKSMQVNNLLDLKSVYQTAEEMDIENEKALCQVYAGEDY